MTATADTLTAPRSGHKQFTVNVISNVAVFTVTFFINLWFVPYLIGNLGVAVYGVVPLATSVTNYMSLLTMSFQHAAGRFLTVEYNRQNYDEANKLFNTAFLTVLLLASIAVPIAVLVVIFAPEIFDIPSEHKGSAQVLFGLVMLAFVVNTFDGLFSLSSWVRNRFDLRNTIQLINRVIRVLLVVIAFQIFGPNLAFVGMGSFVVTLIILIGDIGLWRYLTPQLTLRLSMANRGDVGQLTQMSGWMVIDQIGALLFLNIDLLVLNKILGAEASGTYGPLLMIATYIRTFAGLVVTAVVPLITIQYAHQNWEQIRRRMQQAVKLMGLTIALPIGLVAGLSRPFLSLWLGEGFADYSIVLIVMLIHLAVNLAVQPLFSIQVAYNKVRIPGMVTLLSGIVNLFLAIFLVHELGIIGAPLAGMIVLTLKNLLFTPVYVSYIMRLPITTFYKAIGFSVLGTGLTVFLAYSVAHLCGIGTWLEFLTAIAGISLVYLLTVYFTLLTLDDRQFLLRMVPWPVVKNT